MLLLIWMTSLVYASGYDLTVLHTNDVHAHIQQSNAFGSACRSDASECYGGVARLFTQIDRERNSNPHLLLLDAGDQFQGTPWYNYYGGLAAAHFMKKLGYDAMALGNHEFDRGVDGLIPFLSNVSDSFPVLSCNIDFTGAPELESKVNGSVEVTVGEEVIGIVGYTTQETALLAHPDGIRNISFLDEIENIQEEVTKLKSRGINKIIGLGHAGLELDLKIATEVDGLDIIVGGHSNTFLYTGVPPDREEPKGPYPMVRESPSGDPVLVVQAYTFMKYLGKLKAEFDTAGKLTHWNGNPILLNGSIIRDASVLEEVTEWAIPLVRLTQQIVGETYVQLNGDRETCRFMECNMGNLVTDAILSYHLRPPEPDSWSHVAITLWNGGGIRASIEPGEISRSNVMEVLPFDNMVTQVTMKGRYIRQLLEHGVHTQYGTGKFLQFSGMQVVLDMMRPDLERVVSVNVVCTKCLLPEYIEMEDDEDYTFLTNDYLARGGDGYNMSMAEEILFIGSVEVDCLDEYISRHTPITQGLEGRIQFVTSSEDGLTTDMTTGAVHSVTDDNSTDIETTEQSPTEKVTVMTCAGRTNIPTAFMSSMLLIICLIFVNSS